MVAWRGRPFEEKKILSASRSEENAHTKQAQRWLEQRAQIPVSPGASGEAGSNTGRDDLWQLPHRCRFASRPLMPKPGVGPWLWDGKRPANAQGTAVLCARSF